MVLLFCNPSLQICVCYLGLQSRAVSSIVPRVIPIGWVPFYDYKGYSLLTYRSCSIILITVPLVLGYASICVTLAIRLTHCMILIVTHVITNRNDLTIAQFLLVRFHLITQSKLCSVSTVLQFKVCRYCIPLLDNSWLQF